MGQMLATLCVALSLALFALGGSDPTGEFRLGTMSICRPLNNHGAYFGYDCHIPRCRGRIMRGVGVTCKLMFTTPFYSTCKGPLLCLLGCYTTGL
jgi:hypothetical protein